MTVITQSLGPQIAVVGKSLSRYRGGQEISANG